MHSHIHGVPRYGRGGEGVREARIRAAAEAEERGEGGVRAGVGEGAPEELEQPAFRGAVGERADRLPGGGGYVADEQCSVSGGCGGAGGGGVGGGGGGGGVKG